MYGGYTKHDIENFILLALVYVFMWIDSYINR